MTAPPSLAEAAGARLRPAVARRSPGVGAALDPDLARDRASAWAAENSPASEVLDVRVGSVLYRPDGGCTLRYRVRFDRARPEQVLFVQVPRSQAEAAIRPFPHDPGLPTLRLAVDAALMREVLGRVVPGTGGDRAVGPCRVDVVRHARRGRCVLRYRLAQGAGGPGELRHPVLFGKVYADVATASAAAASARALRAGLPSGAPVHVPEPLAVVPPLRLGLAESIAGRPVLPALVGNACSPDALEPDRGALAAALRSAAGVAAAVHACTPPRGPWPVRTLDGEAAAAGRELALLEPVWPDVAARLRRAVAKAVTVGQERAEAHVLAHGDFTPGQLLLGGTPVGLTDVDTLCLAEPALDLGRFLAYLQVTAMRRSRGARPLLDDLAGSFLESYLAVTTATPRVRRSLRMRTAAYRGLALARIGASACWQLKDDRLRAVLDVIDTDDDRMGSVAG